jgi:hypothetical protein
VNLALDILKFALFHEVITGAAANAKGGKKNQEVTCL